MGSQTNKVLKRKRRESWIKRKNASTKAAQKTKAAPAAAVAPVSPVA
jgi:hypothetical protein